MDDGAFFYFHLQWSIEKRRSARHSSEFITTLFYVSYRFLAENFRIHRDEKNWLLISISFQNWSWMIRCFFISNRLS